MTPAIVDQRLQELRAGFARSTGWAPPASSDAKLPRWDFARLGNEQFRAAVSPKLLTAIERWNPSLGNLVLAGDTGIGKTSLCVAKVHDTYARAIESAKRGEPDGWWAFRFVSALDLVSARRGHKLGVGEAPLVELALSARGALILDEVGFEDCRDQLVFEIADARYRRKLVTVVTTGRAPEAFAERYGAACWRRFTEGGHVITDFAAKRTATGAQARRVQ